MITIILSLILALVFLLFGGIHFYWVCGGKWSLEKVIPTKTNDLNTKPIPKFATIIVGLVFLFFSLIYVIKSGLISIQIPKWITSYSYYGIPTLFLLRAIGDFKYVGFFKSITTTTFATWDKKLFAPLCLLIAIISFTIVLLH